MKIKLVAIALAAGAMLGAWGDYTAASGGTKVTSSTTVTATDTNITTSLTYSAYGMENYQPPDCNPPPYNLEKGWGGAFRFYEEADDSEGLNLAAWPEWTRGDWVPFWFGAGIKVAIPIEGLQYPLTEDDVVLVAGSYSDFGNPQIVSDEWMYQKHYTELKNAIGRAPYETDDGLYGPVFEGDVRGRNYSLSLEIWPDGQSVAGRQWILIEIGGRATPGIKTFYLGLKRQDIYLYYGMYACEEQIGKPSNTWAHGELTVLPWPIGSGTVTGGGVYRGGDNVTLTATSAEYGEFMGWYDWDDERWLGTSPTLNYTSPGHNTAVYAVFKQSTLRTITFDANGGTVSPGTKVLELGEAIGRLPEPEWIGHTFAGWWTSASGGSQVTESMTVSANVTYYAHWTANQYTATFDANGGSGGIAKTQETGTSLTAPTVMRTGYSFTGWSPPVPSTMPASNATYKAQWRIKSYLVCFNAQGGSCNTRQVYRNHNAKIGVLPVASRESFEFLGWYSAADGGEVIDSKTVITGDVTFYAHWRQTAPILTIKNGVLRKVEMGPFIEAVIPEAVTRIGDWAFYSCTNLVSVTIPGSVTSIGSFAFDSCIGLTSVSVPHGVTNIEDHAFSGCRGLARITLPCGVTSIAPYTFRDCESLVQVTIPDGVLNIGDEAFSGCGSLTNAVIPDSVSAIGRDAFSGCDLLFDTVTIPGIRLVDGWAVGYEDALPEILDLSGVRSISDSAFRYCYNLEKIIASDTVTRIGRDAFCSCNRLTSVTISSSVTHIGGWAFFDCKALTKVEILSRSVCIDQRAFACDERSSLKNVYASGELKGTFGKDVFPSTAKISYGTVVQIYVEEEQENMGTVSGYGAYQPGKNVILKATPKKGSAFAGWYEGRFENGKLTVNEGALLSRSASYAYLVPADHVVIVARFVSTDEDAASLKMEVADDVAAEDGIVAFDLSKWVESISQPELTVSGLPSGVKYDAKTMMVSGKATKPGVYTVKVTATNASVTGKNAVVKEFSIKVPNLTTPMFEAAGLDTDEKYVLMAGMMPEDINDVIAAIADDGWKLAVSGLPSGVKYDAKKIKITGIATKEGFFTVYFTATKGSGKSAEKQVATATFEVVFPALTLEMAAWDGANAMNKCKVTGGGRYPFGKKVTLKATPAKGSVFVGWYEGNGEWGTGNGEPISKAASYSYATTDEDVTLTAVFAAVAEDKDSIALKVDGEEVPGPSDGNPTTAYTNYCGVAVDWPIVADALSATTVKATGLPSGVKLVQDKKTGAYSIVGAPSAASKTDKKTGMLNPNLVKLTVTTAGKSSKTYAFTWTILPLPEWVVGTFNGDMMWVTDAFGTADPYHDIVSTFTISSVGKLSGKMIVEDDKAKGTTKTVTVTAPAIVGMEFASVRMWESDDFTREGEAFYFDAAFTVGKQKHVQRLYLFEATYSEGVSIGDLLFDRSAGEWIEGHALQSAWGVKNFGGVLPKLGTKGVVVNYFDSNYEYTFTIKNKGTVAVTAKSRTTGKKVTGAGQLRAESYDGGAVQCWTSLKVGNIMMAAGFMIPVDQDGNVDSGGIEILDVDYE